MKSREINFVATSAGAIAMGIGLVNAMITLANEDYRGVLATSLACTFVGVACLAVPFKRGPWVWRVLAVVLAMPAVYIVAEFVRRAPYAFGR